MCFVTLLTFDRRKLMLSRRFVSQHKDGRQTEAESKKKHQKKPRTHLGLQLPNGTYLQWI